MIFSGEGYVQGLSKVFKDPFIIVSINNVFDTKRYGSDWI